MTDAGRLEGERSKRTSPASRQESGERRVGVLELFFDLVFVLAITQVTSYFSAHLDARGMAEGLVILGLMWWAWVGYSWLTNSVDSEEVPVRLTIFAAMAALVVVALAMPGAFGDEALLVALAYALVRVLQVGLYSWGTSPEDPNHGAILKLAPGFLLSSLLLVIGALIGGCAQLWIWLLALILDMATPLLSDTSGFRVHAGHFAERHGLIVIIALGESIVALGAAASGKPLDLALVVGVALGVAVSASLWWTYFDLTALAAERRLSRASGSERARIARDAYSYLHLPMIVGIVLLALGLKKALAHPGDHLHLIPAIALCAGPAIYLLGLIGFRLRNVRTLSRPRLSAFLVLLVLVPVGMVVPALVALAMVTGVMAAVVTWETVRFAADRRALRS